MRPSDVKRLYYITHQDNLASIFRHGILSHNRVKAKGLKHQRIDNPDVNARRNITLPNGRNLHDYANLFFNCRNAMMYAKVLDPNGPGVNNLCVVGIDRSIVTQVEGVLASDINAAVEGRRIDHYKKMLPILNKAMVFVKYWNDKDEKIKIEKKHKAMAEVLVLDRVPVQFLASVLVGTNGAKESLLQKLPECPVPVIINCGLFFQPFAGTNIPRNL